MVIFFERNLAFVVRHIAAVLSARIHHWSFLSWSTVAFFHHCRTLLAYDACVPLVTLRGLPETHDVLYLVGDNKSRKVFARGRRFLIEPERILDVRTSAKMPLNWLVRVVDGDALAIDPTHAVLFENAR